MRGNTILVTDYGCLPVSRKELRQAEARFSKNGRALGLKTWILMDFAKYLVRDDPIEMLLGA